MPALTPFQGELGIALFTILWGVFIESRFASKWTILFNVVPLIFLLSVVDLPQSILYLLLGYTVFSIGLAFGMGATLLKNDKKSYNNLKQLVGAKGYGALTLAVTLTGENNITLVTMVIWVGIAIPVYYAWHKLRKIRGIA